MSPKELIAALIANGDDAERGETLRGALPGLTSKETDALVEGLMEVVIEQQMADPQRALKTAALILKLADLSGDPRHRAVGLRAAAQTRVIGLGEYQQALPLYDEALAIHRQLGDEVGAARVEVTRIWALASLGRYERAVQLGEEAAATLGAHAQWRSLASLRNNLAMIHRRVGAVSLALEMLVAAHQAYMKLGADGERYLANNALNRAFVLYELGELGDSLEASQSALALSAAHGQNSTAAIAEHNLGMTYIRMGRSNEALESFDRAQEAYTGLGQPHNAALCELSSIECLLELGLCQQAVEKSERVQQVFAELGMRQEVGEALRYQAEAYIKLSQLHEAIQSLNTARQIFESIENRRHLAETDLRIAAVQYRQGEYAASLDLAEKCVAAFTGAELPAETAQAHLAAARAAVALKELEQAHKQVQAALELAEEHDFPPLAYLAAHLDGRLAEARGDPEQALVIYRDALHTLETLRGHVMVEHQPGFVADKEDVFEDLVRLSLDLDRPEEALAYAERGKSRSLKDILAGRPDLRVHARSAEDEPLASEIHALRRERERLMLAGSRLEDDKAAFDAAGQKERLEEVKRIEARLTELWHKLLVRNADYARQASLWGSDAEQALPTIEAGTMLLEFFAIGNDLILFLVDRPAGADANRVRARGIPGKIGEIEGWLRRLNLNLSSTPHYAPERVPALIDNAQKIAHRLYRAILEPVRSSLDGFERLVIVPHGPLHYLPFHALYDGRAYLVEDFEISYLPGASLLNFSQPDETGGGESLAIGCSQNGALPNAVAEAELVAGLTGGQALLESQATRERVQRLAPQMDRLHFACHGVYRPDNPLFSGLELADGWLTTLDVFNLRLKASLVALSACETGRSLLGGGDELLGLMRAFLAAGAASLLLSHWLVEDRATARFMQRFYTRLQQGESKGAALRAVQRSYLNAAGAPQDRVLAHPYFWAAFYLIGDTGRLSLPEFFLSARS